MNEVLLIYSKYASDPQVGRHSKANFDDSVIKYRTLTAQWIVLKTRVSHGKWSTILLMIFTIIKWRSCRFETDLK